MSGVSRATRPNGRSWRCPLGETPAPNSALPPRGVTHARAWACEAVQLLTVPAKATIRIRVTTRYADGARAAAGPFELAHSPGTAITVIDAACIRRWLALTRAGACKAVGLIALLVGSAIVVRVAARHADVVGSTIGSLGFTHRPGRAVGIVVAIGLGIVGLALTGAWAGEALELLTMRVRTAVVVGVTTGHAGIARAAARTGWFADRAWFAVGVGLALCAGDDGADAQCPIGCIRFGFRITA